ncbi:ankyrin repeat-containing domain protein [Zopfochytrium polystomum]|nr:ankyrin repeat-containing domain protein [Zopfochytrium polystomum]
MCKLRIMKDGRQHTTAARWGYDEILTKLLVRGANVNSKDYDGWSLLHCACKSGRPEIVSLLIAHSADVNALDSEGWSCLHFACDVDSDMDPAEIVALFLRVGVDINVKAAKGLTALHLACRWGHWKTTEYLLAAGSIADVKHDNGMTAMHFAAKAGSLRCFEQVLPLNDVNCVDEQGSTVVHILFLLLCQCTFNSFVRHGHPFYLAHPNFPPDSPQTEPITGSFLREQPQRSFLQHSPRPHHRARRAQRRPKHRGRQGRNASALGAADSAASPSRCTLSSTART